MSQCVPSWDVDDDSSRKTEFHAPSTLHVPRVDYEVAELTWKNGQLAMHGLGPRRVLNKPQPTTSAITKYAWDKPRAAAETLEAIVHQATVKPHRKTQTAMSGDELVPWLDRRAATVAVGSVGPSATTTLDALVPSSNDALQSAYFSTHVGSCSGGPAAFEERRGARGSGAASVVEEQRAARGELSSNREHSASGSGIKSSKHMTFETWERELGVKGFTSTSMGSPENTSSGHRCTKSTSPDEHDSVNHSRSQRETSDVKEKKKKKGKSSVTGKRGRAAAVHNQSERKRRDKINQKMKTLQKLVPNASKTDKASMLDEVIEYLKQLQAQIGMMSRMNMAPMMMMPLAMQQQLQMAMMKPMMGMGMGMGMTMDLNSIGGGGFHPSSFMAMPSWDNMLAGDRAPNNIDPMSAFLACQSQPMTMDAYSRMAAMYQQMQNQSGLNN